jgi:glycosyltransferase involved in cell wall biosynthesis
LRLLLVNAHGADASAGGTEKYVGGLASELPRRDVDVKLLAAFPPRNRSSPPPDVVLHRSDWRNDPVRRRKNHVDALISRPTGRLEDAVVSLRPDLVHTNGLVGITTAIWEVCRRLGVPVVHTLHDYYLLCPKVSLMRNETTPCHPHPLLCGLRTRRLERWAGAVSHVIGVSRFVLTKQAGMFDGAAFHVVRHPLEARTVVPPRETLTTLGYIGSLRQTKGVHLLLDALPTFAEMGLVLRIAGDGPMRSQIEALAATNSGLRYDGPVFGAKRDAFFGECDAGIAPSVWLEPGGPPYTVLEWISAGKPVLVSARGGLREAVEVFGGTVAIEPTRQGIVDALHRLLQPDEWQNAVSAARPAQDRSDEERWIHDHQKIYRAAIRGGR